MRTAGMVMGIVGGAIALLLGLVLILVSVAVYHAPWANTYEYNDNDFSDWDDFDDYDWDDMNEVYLSPSIAAADFAGTFVLVPGICALVAGVMGLVGGLIIRKKNVVSGVLMIIAAVLSLFSFFNIISMVLFILGGVFALMRDRQKDVYAPQYTTPPYYPYPPQPQYPYPPQQYPPQPPQQIPEQSAPPADNSPENPSQH